MAKYSKKIHPDYGFEVYFKDGNRITAHSYKAAMRAKNRLRIGGKFITKRTEDFFKEILSDRGIKVVGNELYNILPPDDVDLISKNRSLLVQREKISSQKWDKKTKRRIESFDIYKHLIKERKKGTKIKINGVEAGYTQIIIDVSAFISQNKCANGVPPMFIWAIDSYGEGDMIDIKTDETTVICSEPPTKQKKK